MRKETVTLHVTKTGTYYMTVQLDESISLEDLDDISFEDLVSKSTSNGEDEFDSSWVEESSCRPEMILCLNESGRPYFQEITNLNK